MGKAQAPSALVLGLICAASCATTEPSRAAPPAEKPRWSDFLSRDEVGAVRWSKAHPTWDGRDVVIAVLDTGVDPSVPGLDRMPDGDDPKVIEARDFSGQGHVTLERANVDGEVLRQGDITVRGFDKLTERPLRKNELWLGVFDEGRLERSSVTDIDRNGRGDDRFAVLAFQRAPDGDQVAVVDTDGDGDLSDEKVRHAYASDPEWFTFGTRTGDPLDDKAPVAIALTPVLEEKRVELHFDDGGHGSHCAGIAAGFGIEGRPGFDGIAPGAHVMSLKIGDNGASGGATTKGSMAEAIRYASRWAREHQLPVVMNISYGVGSEVEGAGAIQRILDQELQANRLLSATLSSGNQGPGLSSVGNPAGTLLGWSAGALVPAGAWELLYGNRRPKRPKIFSFSSRGGELDKPDGLAPGVAWSTVPPFRARSVMAGTSMAAPQTAGVMALLISAARAEKRPWTPGLIKRVLRQSARPIANYSSLEQGAGLIDVNRAWALLSRRGAGAQPLAVAGWEVKTPVPGRPGTRAPVSYWRVGGYVPEGDERVAFTVVPRFYGDVGALAQSQHTDRFELVSDVGWLKLDRSQIAIRGDASTTILVGIDRRALTRTGHHVGRVRARIGGLTMFELPVAVIVPESFRHDWQRSFHGRLEAGDVARIFVEVPPGASSMQAHLSIPPGAYGSMFLAPFSPEGQEVDVHRNRASSADDVSAGFVVSGDDLVPGTWELTVMASMQSHAIGTFDLVVEFVALQAPDRLTLKSGPDGTSKTTLELVNDMEIPFRGTIAATVDAYERARSLRVKGDRLTTSIHVSPEVSGLELELELERAVWDRFSDVAVNVLDQSGRAVAQDAFGQRRVRLELSVAPGRYTLEIVGGHADPDDARSWKVALTERHRLATPRVMRVEPPPAMDSHTLWPGVKTAFPLSLPELLAAPDGFVHRAAIDLTRRDGSRWTRLELPLKRP